MAIYILAHKGLPALHFSWSEILSSPIQIINKKIIIISNYIKKTIIITFILNGPNLTKLVRSNLELYIAIALAIVAAPVTLHGLH